jgi:hypothetical protein
MLWIVVFWPLRLEKPREMPHYMFCPRKKRISQSFKISSTLICSYNAFTAILTQCWHGMKTEASISLLILSQFNFPNLNVYINLASCYGIIIIFKSLSKISTLKFPATYSSHLIPYLEINIFTPTLRKLSQIGATSIPVSYLLSYHP